MRLIDADALQIALIKKYDEVADLLEIVDNQPTAFDNNDLLIEMLEEEKEKYTRGYKECLDYGFPIWENLKGRADGINKAIRIVKEYNANKLLQNMQQPRIIHRIHISE